MKVFFIFVVLITLIAPAQAKETVYKHTKPKCFYYIEYEAPFTTHPDDIYVWDDVWSCDEWKKILDLRKTFKDHLIKELKDKGVYEDLVALASYRFDSNNPDKIVRSLNKITHVYSDWDELQVLLNKVYFTRVLGDSFFLRNLFFSIGTMVRDHENKGFLPIIKTNGWQYVFKKGQCGVFIPVFYTTANFLMKSGEVSFGFYFDTEDNTLVYDALNTELDVECPEDITKIPDKDKLIH